ncbi:S-adenosyl-L-methionine-dependent methyltransferase [Paraphaeosphaeria sporulosa]|uniref:S-adenosyl-L-methionine-dependent methyltransferase n=1 Tax=Paraphaeosphaeria sporulosa TaxID=1460663 RepID=A0A177CA42_9PLEO|nr:S-adenosyl-L-methionine-dependent methyltransferase [Paraphaeosphaeria sporulosa]OAG04614.1 S-adenosyl-L-methionine-dependent methyltransferase [Paraphaeosphaeria sporulosa]
MADNSAQEPEYSNALIPESDDSDIDSAIGGLTYASSTTSARSDVYTSVEEFGRTYHGYKSGKYLLPNDEKERDRLDLQHMLFTISCDGALALAPIGNPKRVLDIATGTGIWAMDFAEQYPDARVTGTDLSPIQPSYVPTNCQFEIADAEDEWNYSRPFDYIHGRALLTCFADPRSIIQKAYDNLAPGGYLELQDGLFPFQFMDPQPPPENPLRSFLETVAECGSKIGRPWNNVQHYKRWFEEIGFEAVEEKRLYWPCGPWAKGDKMKKLGVYFLEDLKHAFEPVAMKMFVKILGWTEERTKTYMAEEVMPLLGARKTYMYETVCFTYGRKPLNPPPEQSVDQS